MDDDLIKRLIILCSDTETELLAIEAADRIRQLEAALKRIAEMPDYRLPAPRDIARAALEGKKDG